MYYNSVPLIEDLLKRDIQITKTLRSNHKGVPDIMKRIKSKWGESFCMRKKDLLIKNGTINAKFI